MPRVLIVRGHLVTPWELRPWLELPKRYEVRCLLSGSNKFADLAELEYMSAGTVRDRLPRGLVGDIAARVIGDRYLSADEAFAWADIVHAEELSYWFAADASRRRSGGQFKLVQTIWETLPMMEAFRTRQARRHRRLVVAATDLFLPTTERAAMALRLEGIAEDRITVCAPGIDVERFTSAPASPTSESAMPEHVLISPGRLVWEKGHQDVLRALALLHRGLVRPADGRVARPRLQIVGAGPEEARLRAHAAELGIGDAVEIASVPYDDMPGRFAKASAMVLATQGAATASYHPFDIPRTFWEEQFGMVLAEAMAAGLDIVTTSSGAVPEVTAGTGATLVAPGDWIGIAQALAEGALSRPPAARVQYPPAVVAHFSTQRAAERLAAAYDRLLG